MDDNYAYKFTSHNTQQVTPFWNASFKSFA